MLTSLKISNYALIQELHMKPDEAFTIITGETGAGKSILLGALGLILGQRADLNALKDTSKKCIIEAQFQIETYHLQPIFESFDLDYEPLTIIRREITPNGKSRAFVNDTPVNLSQLKDIGEHLVDIHSQHHTISLNDNSFQLKVVDAYAENKNAIQAYKAEYDTYRKLKKQLAEKELSIVQAKAEESFLQFQFEELDQLQLIENEDVDLEEEQDALVHVEDTKIQLTTALNLLKEQEENVIDSLRMAKSSLTEASKHNKVALELLDRFKSVTIELEDIVATLEEENEELNYDPERLEYIRSRLSAIYNLQKKHHTSNVTDLVTLKNEIEQKLLTISNFDSDVEMIKRTLSQSAAILKEKAAIITANRKAIKQKLESEVKTILDRLGMKNAQLTIEFETLSTYSENGLEVIKFLFTANKGLEKRELSKVASGGELSRLMLAIKSILARKEKMPTIIFDEIDTGVSGEIADKVGEILKSMSQELQIISITHLPQMAAKGVSHLKVYKEDVNGETHSYIKVLNQEERIEELAKMLSGSKTTSAAIDNAKALLNE
ncbi:DNA repair protein RecN [Acidiluteibacter ferrifornacis]|uniref:DNA repair protein RecN n=1 Tax=Acidiluteibacter ferrifornacis TaxID=2692424 RepID=A0A6N9NPZ7_9FLAO|nr:DNA repair protein RecN [Acidiluteibacter ferrifornacis]NBG67177.1 DNA repair protein RecN [Acidiluteibacter ferrifornacis]